MSEAQRTPFVESLLEAAAQAQLPGSGIGWLDAARRENLDAFVAGGLPDTRMEAWKYTALRALAQRRFAAGDAQASTRAIDIDRYALAGIDGPSLVFVNGVFRQDLSGVDNLPAGLTLQPLSQVLQGDAEPLRFALSRHYRDGGDVLASTPCLPVMAWCCVWPLARKFRRPSACCSSVRRRTPRLHRMCARSSSWARALSSPWSNST
jgi:Fe-S cluster assembly protein SufD